MGGTTLYTYFNGYVTWLVNLGKMFPDKDLTIIYSKSTPEIIAKLSPYYRCIQWQKDARYACDRLISTYGSYNYPDNIHAQEGKYLFIHGRPSGKITNRADIYDRYIAVSQDGAEAAQSCYPKHVEYIWNPLVIDETKIDRSLRLMSAQRIGPEKRLDRIETMAETLDELKLPYSWDLFRREKQVAKSSGLFFREPVDSILPYLKSTDYFVLLSDHEGCPYVVLEAMKMGVKLVLTPLKAYKELGLMENPNVTFIPFEYFEPQNHAQLKSLILKIYYQKDNPVSYDLSGYDQGIKEAYAQILK